MSQERIAYLDRMISKLREEQEGLMDEYQHIEKIICEYEKEADKLEAIVNDCNYGGTSD